MATLRPPNRTSCSPRTGNPGARLARHYVEVDLRVEIAQVQRGRDDPSRSASTVRIDSTAPTAPTEWPSADLGAYTAGR